MDYFSASESHTLSNHYVYYNRLLAPESGKRLNALGNKIVKELNSLDIGSQDLSPSIKTLRMLADSERKKEMIALKKIWGTNINYEGDKKDFYKQLIEAINIVMQGEKVFKRNKARLLYQTKEQKKSQSWIDISKTLGEYFQKNYNIEKNKILSLLKTPLAEGDETKIIKILDDELTKILFKSLEEMYSSQTLNKNQIGSEQINKETEGAYQELLSYLQKMGADKTTNIFLSQIWGIYNFDELIKDIKKDLQSQYKKQKRNLNKLSLNNKTISKVSKQTFTGQVAEVQSLLLAQLNFELNPEDFLTSWTGKINNQAADFMFSYKFNLPKFLELEQSLNKTINNTSINAKNAIINSTAYKYMENDVDEYSVIGYVSNKNYTLNDNFLQKNGFQGSSNSLKNLELILENVDGISVASAEMLIGALMQFGDGAIGTGQSTSILQGLADIIANFLFDDYSTTVLNENPGSGLNSLHFFWLSGFYIPLSFFLETVADALTGVFGKTDNIFKFDLETVPIIPELANKLPGTYTHNDWVEQANDTLNRTKVNLHFLRNFQELLISYLS